MNRQPEVQRRTAPCAEIAPIREPGRRTWKDILRLRPPFMAVAAAIFFFARRSPFPYPDHVVEKEISHQLRSASRSSMVLCGHAWK